MPAYGLYSFLGGPKVWLVLPRDEIQNVKEISNVTGFVLTFCISVRPCLISSPPHPSNTASETDLQSKK